DGPYPYGSIVRISANPKLGAYFAGWGNDASGRVNPLDFVVTNANPIVSALFTTLQANEVNFYVSPDGEGMVTASPNIQPYSPGTVVTLTARPAPGWRFAEWQRDASGTDISTSVVLNQNKLIRAAFQILPQYTLEATTDGGGWISGATSGAYPEGASVNL